MAPRFVATIWRILLGGKDLALGLASNARALLRPGPQVKDEGGAAEPADPFARSLCATFVRGIRAAKYAKNGIDYEVFMPDDITPKSWDTSQCAAVTLETSINWEDDPGAVDVTLKGNNGRFGAARVERAHVESIAKLRQSGGVALERKLDPDVPTNTYHGNVLFGVGMHKATIKAVANAVALDAEYVAPKN